MKTVDFFLDIHNRAKVRGETIASRVARQGKIHLWDERDQSGIDTIVIHYAGAGKIDGKRPFDAGLIAVIFCDLGVSCHYMIDRKGTVLVLVPEDKKAWHCGGSIMPRPDSRTAVNVFSIGIELIADADSGFTKKQYTSLARLCADIERRRNRVMVYVGHEDIAGKRAVRRKLRKDEKTDPGEKFDWSGFYRDLRSRRGALRT
jgi:N-acetyl-anhydromuramyl-L-alanine amidase AmpD